MKTTVYQEKVLCRKGDQIKDLKKKKELVATASCQPLGNIAGSCPELKKVPANVSISLSVSATILSKIIIDVNIAICSAAYHLLFSSTHTHTPGQISEQAQPPQVPSMKL